MSHPAHNGKKVNLSGRIQVCHSVQVHCPPAEVFKHILSIGGENGWYFANWLWRFRGWLDSLVGGVGLRRGRPHRVQLAPGDTVDYWRVEEVKPDRLLRLFAEMKLPGRGWLEFEVEGNEFSSTVRQTAIFEPGGTLGLLYWYALYPVHMWIFAGMLRGLARAADTRGKT